MSEIIQKSKYEKDFIERTYSSIVTDASIALLQTHGMPVLQLFSSHCQIERVAKLLLKTMEPECRMRNFSRDGWLSHIIE